MNKEYVEFTKFEKSMNPYMNEWYKSHGYIVDWDCGDYYKDCILKRGKIELNIELKYRTVEYSDILIELVQDMKVCEKGWVHISRADYLHYVVCKEKPIYFYSIKYKKFKDWFWNHYKDFKHHESYKGRGITLNAKVPIKDIPKEYILKVQI